MRVCSIAVLIGRNRMLVLNIFKFIAFRRQALRMIGQLSKKYANFVKQDMAMFEIFEREKRSNHVGSEQEFSEFLQECIKSTKDFSFELYLRARYIPRFLSQCTQTQVRIKDLYIIFDNAAATQQLAQSLKERIPQNKILEKLRKLEFTHSPSLLEQEFFILHQLLKQTTRNLNRFRIDHVKILISVTEIGLNSFLKLKKLRLEHLESDGLQFDQIYSSFLS